MTLLVDTGRPGWMSNANVAERLAAMLPGIDIRVAESPGEPADIRMIVLAQARPGQFGDFPNLELVQKLGAGVDGIVAEPSLAAGVRIARLKDEAPAREITEYCLAYVFAELRGLWRYHHHQRLAQWSPTTPRSSTNVRIGVLGLGHIGGRVARTFSALGFAVDGYSRSGRHVDGVRSLSGEDGLNQLLGECDVAICVLPSTPATRGLLDAARFARMKKGALLVNAGRGNLLVEADLPAALDAGRPGSAVLDVFATEPLPPDHAFWQHPAIRITPHVSGWNIGGDGLATVAENYRRLTAGRPVLHEVDRQLGY